MNIFYIIGVVVVIFFVAHRKYVRKSPEIIAPAMKKTTKGIQIKNVANSRISITVDRMPVVRIAKMIPSGPSFAT